MAWRRLVPDNRPTVARAVVVGIAAAAVSVALRFALTPALGTNLPFITFFPALLAAAVWGGTSAGLLCLGLCCFTTMAVFFPQSDLLRQAAGVAAFLGSGGLLVVTGSALASTVRRLRESQRQMKAAEADLQTLVSELAHRGRNGLTVVMSIISQSARTAGTAEELAEIVNARLGSMAFAQDEVVRRGGNAAALADILKRTVAPFDLDRFVFEPSPDVDVAPETATALALLTHELATNAVKHGALAAPDGQVKVGWQATDSLVRLTWRERGGPPANSSIGAGFGTRLLDAALAPHGGRATRRFEAEGVVCDIDFPPLRPIDAVRRADTPPR